MAQFAYQEERKRDHEDARCPADPRISEPVIFLSLVEDELQAANPEAKQAEADTIEGAQLFMGNFGGSLQENCVEG